MQKKQVQSSSGIISGTICMTRNQSKILSVEKKGGENNNSQCPGFNLVIRSRLGKWFPKTKVNFPTTVSLSLTVTIYLQNQDTQRFFSSFLHTPHLLKENQDPSSMQLNPDSQKKKSVFSQYAILLHTNNQVNILSVLLRYLPV